MTYPLYNRLAHLRGKMQPQDAQGPRETRQDVYQNVFPCDRCEYLANVAVKYNRKVQGTPGYLSELFPCDRCGYLANVAVKY